MQNYVLYATPLIALEILDKERAVIDTVSFSALDLHARS